MIGTCPEHNYIFKHWRQDCPGCFLAGKKSPWYPDEPPRKDLLSEDDKKRTKEYLLEYKNEMKISQREYNEALEELK